MRFSLIPLFCVAFLSFGCNTQVDDNGVRVKGPGVDINVDDGDDSVKVKAPGVDIEVQDESVKVDAPGVDVNINDSDADNQSSDDENK